jgi:CxxC-x17-CxxC domain-containing protein
MSEFEEFQRDNEQRRKPARRSNSRSEGRPRRDSDRTSRKEMHNVVCDKCGKECTVPFRPTNNKPVFCSDCFKKNHDSASRGGSEQRGRSNNSSEDLASINSKLDKIMHALKIK